MEPVTAPASALLRAYDDQLREAAEVADADDVRRDPPLWIARFEDSGFVTYRDLGGLRGAELSALVERTVRDLVADPAIVEVEWKSRGHDAADGLPAALEAAGLHAEPVETVMIGEAAAVAGLMPAELPQGVEVCRVDDAPDAELWLTRAAVMQAEVFGGGPTPEQVITRQVAKTGRAEYWVARAGERVLCAGRLELVPGTEFAGLWGGACVPEWRGRGLYRALTAGRARSAVARGVRYLHSDCTEMSRPILQRAGLVPVTTTTPYTWRRTA